MPYDTYDEAVEAIIEVLRSTSKVQLDAAEVTHARKLLSKALQLDTGGVIFGRLTLFVSKESLRAAIRGEGFATNKAMIELLFPRTWTVIGLYS